MLVGVSVQVRPEEGEIDELRATVPVNPLTGATVMVEVADAPALAVTLVGLSVKVKSWVVTVTLVLWVIPLLLPVTVTL